MSYPPGDARDGVSDQARFLLVGWIISAPAPGGATWNDAPPGRRSSRASRLAHGRALSQRGRSARSLTQALIATMRSIGIRALAARSSGTLTSPVQVAQRVAQLRQRDHLHVAAGRGLVGGDEVHVRRRLAHRVEHARSRSRRSTSCRAVAASRRPRRSRPSRPSRACARLGVDVAGGDVLHDRGHAAALGVDQEVRAGMRGAHVGDVLRAGCRRARGTRRSRRAACGRSSSRRRRRGTCPGRTGSRCPGRARARCARRR